jgi:hypothetical protein
MTRHNTQHSRRTVFSRATMSLRPSRVNSLRIATRCVIVCVTGDTLTHSITTIRARVTRTTATPTHTHTPPPPHSLSHTHQVNISRRVDQRVNEIHVPELLLDIGRFLERFQQADKAMRFAFQRTILRACARSTQVKRTTSHPQFAACASHATHHKQLHITSFIACNRMR